MKRRCSKCKKTQELDRFSKDKYGPQGLACWCKDCQRDYNQTEKGKERQRRFAKTDKRKLYMNEYYKSEEGREVCNIAAKRDRNKWPEKHKARNAVKLAVYAGRLVRDYCRDCESTENLEFHHYLGYDKKHWLDVICLCRSCHTAADREEKLLTSSPQS